MLDGDPVGTQGAPTAAPPHFRPMPIVAKRSPISATAELVFYFISTERTAVKISLRSFEDSYYYSVDRLPALKSYLEGNSNQKDDLAVKVGLKSHKCS